MINKSNLSIKRSPKPFIILEKEIINDKRLNFYDIGFYAYISLIIENRTFPKSELKKIINKTEKNVNSFFKLMECGYLKDAKETT
jgi:glycopeptide antibiotics resistance protein